jgi:hypothetical protein
MITNVEAECLEAAKNPSTVAGDLAMLAGTRWIDVKKAVAGHANADAELLGRMAESKRFYAGGFLPTQLAIAIAENKNTPDAVRAEMYANVLSVGKAAEAAMNPSTAWMHNGGVAYVQYLAIATSPSAPPAMLDSMADKAISEIARLCDGVPQQRILCDKIAGNPSVLPETLAKLAYVNDFDTRAVVASNSATPVKILDRLALDKVRDVRFVVAKNVKSSLVALTTLAKDDLQIRIAVVENPGLVDKELLGFLAQDDNRYVASCAVERLNALNIVGKAEAEMNSFVEGANEGVEIIESRVIHPNEAFGDLLANIAASPGNDEEIDELRTVINVIWEKLGKKEMGEVISELSGSIARANGWAADQSDEDEDDLPEESGGNKRNAK